MDHAIYGAAADATEAVVTAAGNQNWLYFGLGVGTGIVVTVIFAVAAYFLMKKKGIIS